MWSSTREDLLSQPYKEVLQLRSWELAPTAVVVTRGTDPGAPLLMLVPSSLGWLSLQKSPLSPCLPNKKASLVAVPRTPCGSLFPRLLLCFISFRSLKPQWPNPSNPFEFWGGCGGRQQYQGGTAGLRASGAFVRDCCSQAGGGLGEQGMCQPQPRGSPAHKPVLGEPVTELLVQHKPAFNRLQPLYQEAGLARS